MSFEQCCIECLNNDDLVNEFCRLRGIKMKTEFHKLG